MNISLNSIQGYLASGYQTVATKAAIWKDYAVVQIKLAANAAANVASNAANRAATTVTEYARPYGVAFTDKMAASPRFAAGSLAAAGVASFAVAHKISNLLIDGVLGVKSYYSEEVVLRKTAAGTERQKELSNSFEKLRKGAFHVISTTGLQSLGVAGFLKATGYAINSQTMMGILAITATAEAILQVVRNKQEAKHFSTYKKDLKKATKTIEENASVKGELKTAKEELERLQAATANVKEELDAAKASLQETRDSEEDKKAEIVAAGKKKLTVEAGALRKEKNELIAEITNLQETKTALEERLYQLEIKTAELTRDQGNLKQACDEVLIPRNEALKTENSTLNTALTKLRQEKSDLEAEVKVLKAELEALAAKKATV